MPDGFTPLELSLDVEADPWTDMRDAQVHPGVVERIGLMRGGTREGRATVMMLVRTDDGQWVVGETTLRLFTAAARSIAACPLASEPPNDVD